MFIICSQTVNKNSSTITHYKCLEPINRKGVREQEFTDFFQGRKPQGARELLGIAAAKGVSA